MATGTRTTDCDNGFNEQTVVPLEDSSSCVHVSSNNNSYYQLASTAFWNTVGRAKTYIPKGFSVNSKLRALQLYVKHEKQKQEAELNKLEQVNKERDAERQTRLEQTKRVFQEAAEFRKFELEKLEIELKMEEEKRRAAEAELLQHMRLEQRQLELEKIKLERQLKLEEKKRIQELEEVRLKFEQLKAAGEQSLQSQQ